MHFSAAERQTYDVSPRARNVSRAKTASDLPQGFRMHLVTSNDRRQHISRGVRRQGQSNHNERHMRAANLSVAAQARGVVRRGVLAETTPSGNIELGAMTPGDDFRSSAGAPLLAGSRVYGSRSSSPLAGDDHGGGQSATRETKRLDLGTWFMYALTFSAGISGLLFGYEYVIEL